LFLSTFWVAISNSFEVVAGYVGAAGGSFKRCFVTLA
jgi:hypothetical protein